MLVARNPYCGVDVSLAAKQAHLRKKKEKKRKKKKGKGRRLTAAGKTRAEEKGLAGSRTQIAGIKIPSASHYTTKPVIVD